MTAYSAGRMSISPAVYVPPLSQLSDDHSPSPPPHHTVVLGGGEEGGGGGEAGGGDGASQLAPKHTEPPFSIRNRAFLMDCVVD